MQHALVQNIFQLFAYVSDCLARNKALHLITVSKLVDECYRLNTLKCKYNHSNDTDMGIIRRLKKRRHAFQIVKKEHLGQAGRTGMVMRRRIKVSNILHLYTGLEST